MKKEKRLRPSYQILSDSNYRIMFPNVREFYKTLHERQEIWYKRFVLKQKPPWSEDEIFKNYNFTNGYRELDRNTVWLINNVIDIERNEFEVFWKIVVFRYFNNPYLFETIGGIPNYRKFDDKKFGEKIVKYHKEYGRIFTLAYLINPPKKLEDRKLGMNLFYVKNVNEFYKMAKDIFDVYKNSSEPIEFIKELQKLSCIAGFLAYEIYCDLCYTNWFKYDLNQYVNVGPGAMYSLKILFPYLQNKGVKRKEFEEKLIWLKNNAEVLMEKFGLKNFKKPNRKNWKNYKNGTDINLRTIEHWLCEYGKYFKMKNGVGKKRKVFEIVSKNNLFD